MIEDGVKWLTFSLFCFDQKQICLTLRVDDNLFINHWKETIMKLSVKWNEGVAAFLLT